MWLVCVRSSISGPHCVILVQVHMDRDILLLLLLLLLVKGMGGVCVVCEVFYLWTSLCHTGTGTHGQGILLLLLLLLVKGMVGV